MKTKLAWALSAALLTAPLGASFAYADDAEKLAEVQTAIAELMQQLEGIKEQRSDLENQLETSETGINDLRNRIQEIKDQLKQKENELGALVEEKKTS